MGNKKTTIGRPKLPKGEARDIVLSVRLSKREHALIKNAVASDMSGWARDVLLAKAANMPAAKR